MKAEQVGPVTLFVLLSIATHLLTTLDTVAKLTRNQKQSITYTEVI